MYHETLKKSSYIRITHRMQTQIKLAASGMMRGGIIGDSQYQFIAQGWARIALNQCLILGIKFY